MTCRKGLVSIALSAGVLALVSGAPLLAQEAVASAPGEREFRAHCSRCHGMDGAGGEGPSLARPFLTHVRDANGLASVIRNGIPGTGMPGTWFFSAAEVEGLVSYVTALGRTPNEPLPGDPERGRDLFEKKGACT